MKSLSWIKILCLYLTLGGAALAGTNTITFDDLNPGSLPGGDEPYDAPIPNGYNGLQWNNLWIVNVPESGAMYTGYNYGLVSGNNLAYNAYGNPASISGAPFNLNSAYLTAAVYTTVNLEVQGFVGTTLAYDNSYILNESGPTLIDFNYVGVDEVNFICSFLGRSDLFAMDNLTISTVPEPSSWKILFIALIGFSPFGRAAGRSVMRRR